MSRSRESRCSLSQEAPFSIALDASQGLALHTAVSVRVPSLQDLEPDRVYPLLHVGLQLDPLDSLEQGDATPLPMAAVASQSLVHTAVLVKSRSMHVVTPTRTYPVWQTGTHVSPLKRVSVQLPGSPFGVYSASHALSIRENAVAGPESHSRQLLLECTYRAYQAVAPWNMSMPPTYPQYLLIGWSKETAPRNMTRPPQLYMSQTWMGWLNLPAP